ncbi:unnamed protein product [Mycena citricolor]|uniref:NACHT domain-containing protein n=1 Tax=Mycena citricolor TaxID=2018698 RepID=A0AAD2H922_9AGAR|nr:unnamed protein product [Mycena citricolor]
MANSQPPLHLTGTPVPPSGDAWKTLLTEAVEEYERITRKKLDELPFAQDVKRCNTVDDFCVILAQHKQTFGDFRSQDNGIRRVLKPLTAVLQFVINPVAEGTSAVVPGGKGILVAFAALLEATNRVSTKYDSLELILDRFQPCLTRLDIYLIKLPAAHRQLLHNTLLKILVLIIKTFGLLTLYIQKMPKPSKFRLQPAKMRIKDWVLQMLGSDDVQGALNELDQLTKEESLATSLENLLVSLGIQRLIVEDHIQTWLDPYNTGKRFDDLSQVKHDGTCEWFFDERFEKWIGLENSMYWVHGKPAGAGKSVSMSAVVEHLETEKELIAFAFISYREEKSQHLQSVLSALVYQLATKARCFHDQLRVSYDQRGSTLSASPPTLFQCLLDMIKCAPKHVIILIDGLDEYPNPGRTQDLLPFLRKLHGANLSNLRLLLASRPEQDIHHVLQTEATHWMNLEEKAGSRKEDISSFVRAQIQEHRPDWSHAIQRKVEEILTGRANGMFLLVSLQMSHLLMCETSDIEKELAELPRDVTGTYDRIMEGLRANGSFHRSQNLLDAIAMASYALKESTAAAIVMVGVDWVNGTGAPQPPDPFDARDVIRRCASSFLEINGASEVRFVHFTAQEYVKRLNGFDADKAEATLFMALTTAALLGLVDRVDRLQWHFSAHRVHEVDMWPLLSRLLDPPNALLPQILDKLGETSAGSLEAIDYEAETGQSAAELAVVFDSCLHWAMYYNFTVKAKALLVDLGHQSSHSRPMQVLIHAVTTALKQKNPGGYYLQQNSWARPEPRVSDFIDLQHIADQLTS